jgi:ribose transport system substrate-binding protein
MRRFWYACLAAAICAAGCGGPGSGGGGQAAGPKPEGKKVIGAALLTQTHVFYQDLVKAMQDEASKHGYDLQVQYAEFSGSKQNDQLDTFILQGVDAIIVSPTDSAGIAPAIAEARAKKIPVFTVDIAAQGADVVSHIASDNVEGGRIIGEYLAKLLGGKGDVAIVDHPETASVQERTKGFADAIAKFPEMKIVQRIQAGGQRDKALQATQDLLQSNPGLSGIFGINDDSALGALAAVQAAGLSDKVVIVGYDGTPEAREAIIKGTALKADTVQHPENIGRKAIEVLSDYFAGKEVPKVVPVSVDTIDAASLKAAGGA